MPDSIGWMFEESSSLGIVNNDNAAVARFNGSIKTFLREAIQNSADALWPRVEDNLPNVEINIKIRKLTGRKKTEFLKSLEWDDLKEHLDAVANSDSNIDALNIQITEALKLLEKGLFLISIEDFNTSGLFGKEPLRNGEDGYLDYINSDDPNAFTAAAFGIGVNAKLDPTAGGAFGFGKFALMKASMFHTLLFNSNISDTSSPRKEGERNVNLTDYSDGMKFNRFIGQCGLADHRIEKDGILEEFGSTGQFGKLGTYTKPNRRGSENILDKVGSVWNNKDLVESLYLDRGKKAGTSVMIVGYNPTLDIEEKKYEDIELQEIVNVIRKTVSINFWPAIVKNPKFGRNLEVSVEAYENDQNVVQREKIDPSVYMEPYITLYKEYEEDIDNPEHNFTDTETLNEVGSTAARVLHLEIPKTKPKRDIGEEKFHPEVNHDMAILTKVLSRSNPQVPKECINTIALVRGPGMIVNYEFSNQLRNVPKSFVSVAFAGTFAQSDEDALVAERFFRNAENVKHDVWEASSAIRNLYPRGIVSHLRDGILRQMPKLVKSLFQRKLTVTSDIPTYMQNKLVIPGDDEGVSDKEKTSFSLHVNELRLDGDDYDVTATITSPPTFEGVLRLQIGAYEAATRHSVPITILRNSISKGGEYVDNDILEVDSSQLPTRGRLNRKIQFKCKIKNTMVGFNPAYTGLVVEKSPKILREV